MSDRMRGRVLAGVLLAAAIAAAVGVFAYNAGVAHGLAESARLGATAGTPVPYIYVGPRFWGFGFLPFFLLLLTFFAVRRLLWGGPRWGWGGGDRDVPPRFEEWHRRLHERDAGAAR